MATKIFPKIKDIMPNQIKSAQLIVVPAINIAINRRSTQHIIIVADVFLGCFAVDGYQVYIWSGQSDQR